jgi:hypothetical protein
VAINAGAEPAALVVDVPERVLEPIDVPGLGGGHATRAEDGRVRLDLPPRSGTLVRVG